jgi:hypothetical protein
MPRGLLTLSLVVGLAVVACGEHSTEPGGSVESTQPPPTTTLFVETITTVSTPGQVEGEHGIIVPPGPDGALPEELVVGCQHGPTFSMSDLEQIEPLETSAPSGVAEAIEPFLSGEEGGFWPQENWLVLKEAADEVLLVARATEGLAFMSVLLVDGEWLWSGASAGGPCPLYFQVPEGLNPVDWRLDPAATPPDPGSTEIDVLITERPCVSGQEIGDRLLVPEIVMTEDSVRIAFAAEPPPGDAFDCQGNPETPHRVVLPAPLGERRIFEGMAIGLDLEDYLP